MQFVILGLSCPCDSQLLAEASLQYAVAPSRRTAILGDRVVATLILTSPLSTRRNKEGTGLGLMSTKLSPFQEAMKEMVALAAVLRVPRAFLTSYTHMCLHVNA